MAKRKPPKRPQVRNMPDSGPKARGYGRRGKSGSAPGRSSGGADLWLYGAHAVFAALANPRRRLRRLLVTEEALDRHGPHLESLRAGRREALSVERVAREVLAERLPEGAVHQGLAVRAEPLDQPSLAELLAALPEPNARHGDAARAIIVALDQITDPQNVGAILRSAAAFGATAVLTTRRHAAPESGALAKAASGALDHLAYLQVANLTRALDQLKGAGFRALGLDAEGAVPLSGSGADERLVLVLGAEGTGLRRLTRERCDLLVRLPTQGPIGQLNVSNAAAVALYELLGRPSG